MTSISGRGWHRRGGSTRLAGCLVLITSGAMLIAMQGSALAATAPPLGTADSFAVLAGTTVTNTNTPTVVNGDLGLSPGTSVTGFPPGTVTGSQDINDPAAATAQTDLTAAYNNAAGQPPTTSGLSGIGNQTLTPGVYNAASALLVNGTLTLDAQGDANAVFIFQVGSALTTASGSTIALVNGAQACNIFWQVGSSATLGTGSTFAGSVLALTSITVTTGDTVDGRVLASNGAVTLDDDAITAPTCLTVVGSPLASMRGLVAAAGVSGLAGLGWFLVRRRRTAALA